MPTLESLFSKVEVISMSVSNTKRENITPFIDLNGKGGRPPVYKNDFTIDKDGGPICQIPCLRLSMFIIPFLFQLHRYDILFSHRN